MTRMTVGFAAARTRLATAISASAARRSERIASATSCSSVQYRKGQNWTISAAFIIALIPLTLNLSLMARTCIAEIIGSDERLSVHRDTTM